MKATLPCDAIGLLRSEAELQRPLGGGKIHEKDLDSLGARPHALRGRGLYMLGIKGLAPLLSFVVIDCWVLVVMQRVAVVTGASR